MTAAAGCRVAFRVDASVEMGTGHLMRCLTLADALRTTHGAHAAFVTRGAAGGLLDLVRDRGHDVHLLPAGAARSGAGSVDGTAHAHWLPAGWSRDAEDSRSVLASIGPVDWLVVDHYALDARWEQVQRPYASRILAIDDLADRSHDCDVLLDQNFVAGLETRYDGLVPADCTRLLGPRFALLRPQFAQARQRVRRRSGRIGTIVVCFGGSDADNVTERCLDGLAQLRDRPEVVHVIAGSGNPHHARLAQRCQTLPGAALHRHVEAMATVLAEADLAIGAGGVMSWERCCVGVPTIAVAIAQNQLGALDRLASEGALIYLGTADTVKGETFRAAVQSLADAPDVLRGLGETAGRLVDGQGLARVAEAITRPDGMAYEMPPAVSLGAFRCE